MSSTRSEGSGGSGVGPTDRAAPEHLDLPAPAAGSLARRTLAVGAVLGLLGVAAGAFGAHALRDSVSARDLEIWQTAAHYQQVHAAVLVALGLAIGSNAGGPSTGRGGRALAVASTLLIVGVLVFSGTLYAMVLGGPRGLGAVTPLGGLSLMAGWAALAVHGLSRRRR